MAAQRPPYWLIREPNAEPGIGIVELDDAITAEQALGLFRARWEKDWQDMLPVPTDVTATLVSLTYTTDGLPVVTEVK